MYGHLTRLSWPETRVKIYFWGEIMACDTLQTKQKKNLLVIHFICKFEPNPTKSQQNRKKKKKKKEQEQVKGIELILAKFHFPPKILVSKLIFHPSYYDYVHV